MSDYDALERKLKKLSREENDKGNHELGHFLYVAAIDVSDLWSMLKASRKELLDRIQLDRKYKCFHCGKPTVCWDSDFSFEDYAEEGEGIIHELHCTECGARITYRIPIEEAESTRFMRKIEGE